MPMFQPQPNADHLGKTSGVGDSDRCTSLTYSAKFVSFELKRTEFKQNEEK